MLVTLSCVISRLSLLRWENQSYTQYSRQRYSSILYTFVLTFILCSFPKILSIIKITF